jgi:branched-chain amino acid transport system substrate-binding protein
VARLIRRRELLAGAGAAALGAATTSPVRAAYGDTPIAPIVTLGVVAPFTGDYIRLGEQIGNGVRAATDDANRIRGIMDKSFTMRTFDDQNLLATGLVNAGFACDDPTIVCVIGHLSGTITDAALRTYVNGQMPLIVPTATYDPITAHGYGNVWRLATKDSTEGRLTALFVEAQLKPKVAAALYQDGDYGFDVAGGFHDQLLNDKIDSKAIRFSFDKPDFIGVAKATAALKPDVVYLAGRASDMGAVIVELRAQGYTGPLYASQGFFDAATLQKFKDDTEGLIVSTPMPPLQLAPTVFRIRSDFEARYGQFTNLSAFAYAAAQIAIAAVNRGATDRLSLARQIALGGAWQTCVGTLQFNNTGDPLDPDVYFYTIKNGTWKYAQAAHPNGFILK